MYDDEIKALNKWFDDEERDYFTSFNGEEYIVDESEIDDFCNLLRELDQDLIGIPCMVDKSGIWFSKNDLRNASHY